MGNGGGLGELTSRLAVDTYGVRLVDPSYGGPENSDLIPP